MQGAGKMSEESFGAAISAQALRRHLARNGADVEDIAMSASAHILPEQVA